MSNSKPQFMGALSAVMLEQILDLGHCPTEAALQKIIDNAPKTIFTMSLVFLELEGGHKFHTYLFQPPKAGFFGLSSPKSEQSVAVMIHANTGLGYVLCGSQFQGALIERGSDGIHVNIMACAIIQDKPTVSFQGVDFKDGQASSRSTLSPERIIVADPQLGILSKMVSGGTVTHCQKIGLLQALGLAAVAGYSCSFQPGALLSHTNSNSTACAALPPQQFNPLTISGRTVRS